jgi:CHASE1-domain containing sensor protein
VVAVSLLLTLVLVGVDRRWAREREMTDFAQEAEERASALQQRIAGQTDVTSTAELLMSLAIKSVESSGLAPTIAAYHEFANQTLSRHPGMVAIGWATTYPSQTAAPFHLVAASLGLSDLQVTEYRDGMFVPETPRERFVPVLVAEYGDKPGALVGYDLASDPVRAAALDRAWATGRTSASGLIRLIEFPDAPLGIMFAVPLNRQGVDGFAIQGYIILDVRLDRAIANSFAGAPTGMLGLTVTDGTDGPRNEQILATYPEGEGYVAGRPRLEQTINVLDRQWRLAFYPLRGYQSRSRSFEEAGVLGAGLAITLLLGAYLAVSANRAARIAQLAGEREQELSARRRLEIELAHQAYHDPLTGLPNRARFLECLSRALADTGAGARSPSCSSTWTTSRSSTTVSVTIPAMRCSRPWPGGCAAARAPATWWRGSAVTSSCC